MKLGIKNQFYPDAEQKAVIEDTFNNTRFIKNYFLAQRNFYWQDNKDLPIENRAKPMSSLDQINHIKLLKIQKFSLDLNKANQLFEREKTAALLGSYKFQWIDQQTPAVGIGKYEGRIGKTDQQTTNCS